MSHTTTFRSSFDVLDQHGCIVLIDRDEGRTITNDAMQVVAYLRHHGFDVTGKPVIYRDTTGRWDGIEVRGGQFAGFYALGGTIKQAARRALARKELALRLAVPLPVRRPRGRPSEAAAIQQRIAKLGLHLGGEG